MRRLNAVALALVTTVTLNGCATLGNTVNSDPEAKSWVEPYQVFGGVCFDLMLIDPPIEMRRPIGVYPDTVTPLLGFLDLPFSAVADTILLPVTAGVFVYRHCNPVAEAIPVSWPDR